MPPRRLRSCCFPALALSALITAAVGAAPLTLDINGALTDGGDCNTIGSWDGSGLCTVEQLDLESGSVLTIENATLLISGDLWNRQGSSIDNVARLEVHGLFVNEGGIAVGPDARLELEFGGRLDNRGGSITNHGVIVPYGPMDNSGEIDNFGDLFPWKSFTNEASGLIRNDGRIGFEIEFENSGVLIGHGSLQAYDYATFDNRPTGVVALGGSIWLDVASRLVNSGTWDNTGWIDGLGITIENSGVINNHGTINLCDDGYGGALTNVGTINNFKVVWNCGTVDNQATIHSSGQLGGHGLTMGTVENSGTILNCGLLTSLLMGNPPVPDLDDDADLYCNSVDCAPTNSEVWRVPGEVTAVRLSRVGGTLGEVIVAWDPPQNPGGTVVLYDVVSSSVPNEFDLFAACVETADGSDTMANDPVTPGPGGVSYYLVRPANSCGQGSPGFDSNNVPRVVLSCP